MVRKSCRGFAEAPWVRRRRGCGGAVGNVFGAASVISKAAISSLSLERLPNGYVLSMCKTCDMDTPVRDDMG